MRALVVSNMQADAEHPERGSFVRDQVSALQAIAGLDVELFEFAPGAKELARAGRTLRRRFPAERAGAGVADGAVFDVVHAHFGLSAWPALGVPTRVRALTLHGTDLEHPRTRIATSVALPFVDLVATVSAALAESLPRWARGRAQVLPCGASLERFRALDRTLARGELGLRAEGPYLLFAADPARKEKRYDRARELAADAGVELLTLGGVDPAQVPRWINAANAVLAPSAREGFGLAVVEALACDVPVLATPVGIHAQALDGVDGTLCAPFDRRVWGEALAPHVRAHDPRIAGRARAEAFSASTLAMRVAEAWCAALERAG